jgi:hypothetical protein
MTSYASPRSHGSRRLARLAFAFAAVLAAVASTGCADSEPAPLGTLEVSWTFGPNSCAEAGVDRIAIELDDAIVREADCEDGEAIIEDLEPGSRQLSLTGLDLDGVERFAAVPETVAIVADGIATADDVLLSALPARVDVTWYFTNGRLCSTNAIDEVELSVWRDGFLEGSTGAACDEGKAAIAGLSSGTFIVELRALDGRGNMVTTAETEVDLEKGDRRELEVPLAVDAN